MSALVYFRCSKMNKNAVMWKFLLQPVTCRLPVICSKVLKSIIFSGLIANSFFYFLPLSLFSSRQHLSYDVCLEVRGRLSEMFCVVLCTEAVHSHKHT